MCIPEKAIITARTEEEADRLLDFLTNNGWHWAGSNCWDIHEGDTCYNLEPYKHICYSERDWYEEFIEEYNNGKQPESEAYFLPDDPNLLFISTDDFLLYCTNDGGCHYDHDIDMADLI